MRFYCVHDPLRQRVAIYCEIKSDPNTGARTFLTRRTGEHWGEEVQEVGLGMEPPLWDWFPDDAVGPLAEALASRPAATERHLDDALEVRDRLLTLVEATAMINDKDGGPQNHVEREALIRHRSGGPL
jgi:hypothetical protein